MHSPDSRTRFLSRDQVRNSRGRGYRGQTERRLERSDDVKGFEIKSPQNGVVHELNIHAVGGVVSPGETIMLLVPSRDTLSIELRVSPSDIDHVAVGTKAVMRLTAFNQRTTPELGATVTRVAANISHDAQSGQSFYVAKVAIDPDALSQLRPSSWCPACPSKPLSTQVTTPWRVILLSRLLTNSSAR